MAICSLRILRRFDAPVLRTTVLDRMTRGYAESAGNNTLETTKRSNVDSNGDGEVARLFDGVRSGNRAALGRAITLIESSHPTAKQRAKTLLTLASAHIKRTRPRLEDRAYRVGITGPPGVGKSSFIESFGTYLLDKQLPHNGALLAVSNSKSGATAKSSREAEKAKSLECGRLAVLCIDPSSAVTGGSILGDRTRMLRLSQHERAFIRPSPSGARLGGVARSTAECMTLCECAGYDLLLVETVGVGQSECAAVNLVDAFVCIVQPGSGDEVQAIKRGVIELADIVAVNKFDGELASAARRTATAYGGALKVLRGRSDTWRPIVVKVSALTGGGFEQLSVQLRLFRDVVLGCGELATRRAEQRVQLFHNELRERVFELVHGSDRLRERLAELESAVRDESALAGFAADAILDTVFANTTLS